MISVSLFVRFQQVFLKPVFIDDSLSLSAVIKRVSTGSRPSCP